MRLERIRTTKGIGRIAYRFARTIENVGIFFDGICWRWFRLCCLDRCSGNFSCKHRGKRRCICVDFAQACHLAMFRNEQQSVVDCIGNNVWQNQIGTS